MIARPKAVDLFAGCGGLTLGLKQAGFEVVLAVEMDQAAGESYALNHKDVPLLCADVREVNLLRELRALGIRKGELDLLAACPPCQGFSTLRTLNDRHSVSDSRNDLVQTVAEILEAVRPKTFLLENVPNLRRDQRFKRLLNVLETYGYFFNHEIVDAYSFGVPQHRRRLVLAASILASPAPYIAHRTKKTVADAISVLPPPGRSGDPLHDHVRQRTKRVQRMISLIPKNGGSRSALPTEMVLACHQKTTGFKDVYGRLAWEAPANTITSGCTNPSKGRFLHPEQDRPLSLREAALLQSFPKRYRFAGKSVAAIALQIGNAIPPPLAKAHASALASTLKFGSS